MPLLQSYTLPEDLRRQAKQIYLEVNVVHVVHVSGNDCGFFLCFAVLQSPSAVLGEEVESGDVRRAVSFILDCHQLLTPSCLALTLDQVATPPAPPLHLPPTLFSLLHRSFQWFPSAP